ncbi:uncharacterized protein ACMZJ9_000878 [Mantella aurantiaca]
MEQSHSRPDNVSGSVDTPRTSNLKFLRAKRLSYFCGKSSQSLLSSAEETPRSVTHKNQQPRRSHTPRRCLSAPILQQKQTSATCDVHKRDNVSTQIVHSNEEYCLQPVVAKTVISTKPEEIGSANKSNIELTVHSLPNSYDLQTASIKYSSESSVSHGAHQSLEELKPEACLDNQSPQQTTSKETKNTPLSKHNVQPTLENERSKVVASHDVHQEYKEVAMKKSLPYYPVPEKAKTKDPLIHSPCTLEPEVETNGHSTHRSLLRSSLASDLDKGLLDDISVPEAEKLQHVMMWAKKFLNKCNVGDVLPFSEEGDGLLNTLDEKDSAFEAYQMPGTVDKYVKVNDIPSDSTLKNDEKAELQNGNIKKQAFTSHSMKESKQSCLSKSPINVYKIKSDVINVSRTHVFSPNLQTINYSNGPMSPLSESDHRDYTYTKPLKSSYPHIATHKADTDSFRSKNYDHFLNEFVDYKGRDCSDDNDLFGTQWNYSLESSGINESGGEAKHPCTIKEDNTNTSEYSLDTERLNILLENLEQIQKVTEQETHVLEKDGSKTNRTFLVRKRLGPGDGTVISESNNVLGRVHSSTYRTYKERNLSEESTPRTYRVCTVCNFSNTTKTSWCEECGSVLGNGRGLIPKSNTTNDLPSPPIAHEKVLDEFLSFSNETFEGIDKMPTVKQMDREGKSKACWEDNSDIVSDSDCSVLEQYFHYVKHLDMLKVQQKDNQSRCLQGDHSREISSEDESYEEIPKLQINNAIHNYHLTKTRAANDAISDGDEGGPEFLEATSHSVKPYKSHLNPHLRSDREFRGSNDNDYETDSKLKSSIDRKQENTPQKSSKGTGPKRYWEKSSIAWSSYTHGELRPRSQHNIQRPSSAEPKSKKDQGQSGKESDHGMSGMTTTHIQRQNITSLTKTAEYKSVAAAYMKTANAWVVTEHLCKDNSGGPSCRLQWAPYGNHHDSMWLFLPDEMWIKIFANLLHKDLSNVAQVCRRFRYIANDDSLWKVIRITNCHSLTDNCLVSIGLHQPESLSLYRCHDESQNITEEGLGKLFQHCKASLTELNITNCSGLRFEGDMVLSYASTYCTQLTSVDISWTGATDKGIIALVAGCAQLQNLSMNGCKITDRAITALLRKHSKSLLKLEVFGCHAITAKNLISVTTECSYLENLNIGRIPKVSDVCLAKIASDLPRMNTLNLTGLNVVRDRAVHFIVKQCTKLENITLSSCCQVTDVSLVEIGTYLRTVKYLDVSGCKKISDIGIQALARSCQQIRYLDLSSTGTGKRGVCLLASYCYNSLECLKLSFCKEVTFDAIEKLYKNCKRLKMLHLYGCRISSDLEHIKQFSKSLQIFHDLSIPTANILGE